MQKIMLLMGIFLIAAMLFSCASSSIPEEKPAMSESLAQGTKALSKADWELEWEKTLAAARKESKVVLYTTTGAERRQAMMEVFPARTGIALEMVQGTSTTMPAKLLTERRNGLFLADVWVGSASPFTHLKSAAVYAPIEPVLFLPEVVDPKVWYGGTLPWYDKDKTFLQTRMNAETTHEVVFIRGSVNENELTSWYDLLKPQFKGRIIMLDPTAVGGRAPGAVSEMVHYYGLGWDYLKALVKQEPFLTRDPRQQLEAVVRGKYLLAIFPSSPIILEFREAEVPLESYALKESIGNKPIGSGQGYIGLITKAPNPNAAKIFINWWLSKEGQTVYHRSTGKDVSAREDIIQDWANPKLLRQPGIKYPVASEEDALRAERDAPIIKEIFSPLIK